MLVCPLHVRLASFPRRTRPRIRLDGGTPLQATFRPSRPGFLLLRARSAGHQPPKVGAVVGVAGAGVAGAGVAGAGVAGPAGTAAVGGAPPPPLWWGPGVAVVVSSTDWGSEPVTAVSAPGPESSGVAVIVDIPYCCPAAGKRYWVVLSTAQIVSGARWTPRSSSRPPCGRHAAFAGNAAGRCSAGLLSMAPAVPPAPAPQVGHVSAPGSVLLHSFNKPQDYPSTHRRTLSQPGWCAGWQGAV
jgi:hypothetical protein